MVVYKLLHCKFTNLAYIRKTQHSLKKIKSEHIGDVWNVTESDTKKYRDSWYLVWEWGLLPIKYIF